MKSNPEISPRQCEIASTTEAAERLCDELLAAARRQGFQEEDLFAIHLALEEALVNAVQHGNQNDPHKKVTIHYTVTPEQFEITITDQGPGFQPDDLPDPRCPENLCKCSGRGVLLIRSYMDRVEYNPKGNEIHMVKLKCNSESGPDDTTTGQT